MIENGVNRSGNIRFIGVARAMDRTMVASLTVRKEDPKDQYHTAVREVLAAPDFSNKVKPGSRYRLVGEVNAFNFTVDTEQRVYIIIAACSYPERLIFQMLNDLVTKFKQELGPASITCQANTLDGRAKNLFTALAEEYDDPTKRDKLSQVSASVQDVKLTMHRNLETMVDNLDRARDVEESSVRLQSAATRFDEGARILERRERWKKYRVMACAACGVLVIVAVLILALQPWNMVKPSAAPTAAAAPTLPPSAPTPAAPTLAPVPAPAPTAPTAPVTPPTISR